MFTGVLTPTPAPTTPTPIPTPTADCVALVGAGLTANGTASLQASLITTASYRTPVECAGQCWIQTPGRRNCTFWVSVPANASAAATNQTNQTCTLYTTYPNSTQLMAQANATVGYRCNPGE